MALFFFNDTATTEIYTLSLHDALPIYERFSGGDARLDLTWEVDDLEAFALAPDGTLVGTLSDRKSTRLNSSHANISYAVFCLKQKKISFLQSVPFFSYSSPSCLRLIHP